MLPNNQKGRYWAFVLYLDSAPAEWKDILQQTGLSIAISPLHDKDFNPTNEVKKPHYHVIMCWDGPTTYKNVCSIVCDVLHQPHPIKIEAVRGYYRYLTHKDNPEKAQYNEVDVKLLNGFNIEDYDVLTERDCRILSDQIEDYIEAAGIIEYRKLIQFLRENELFNHLNYARNHTIYFTAYIRSKRHEPLPDPRQDK